MESAWQRRVWRATADLSKPRFIYLNAGRGAGKDIIAVRCVLRDALRWYSLQKRRRAAGRMRLALNPLVKIWVAAPQDHNLTQTWDDYRGALMELAAEWGPQAGFDSTETDWLFREIVREGKIVLLGRGEIEIEKRITSTRNALRGPGVDLCHWTEFASENTPGEIQRAFHEELPGTMTRSGRLGRFYGTTTPRGPMGSFWDELALRFGDDAIRDAGQAVASHDGEFVELKSNDGLYYYGVTDSYANEFLSPEQREAIRAESANGWLYEQERKAQFVIGDLGGDRAFERWWVEKCMIRERAARDGFRRVWWGVDIARMGTDETVHLGIDDVSGEILRIEVHSKRTGPEIIEDLKRLHNEYPGSTFFVDSTGHRGYIADFAPSWLPIVETQFSREKEKWVGGLKMLLQMGKIRIPDPERCAGLEGQEREALRKLLKQVFAFVRIVKQNGTIVYSHPQGEHDDCVDALLLASMRMAERLQETLGAAGTRRAIGKIVV